MTELNGTVSAAFEPVRDVVKEQLRNGAEVGLSLVVDLDGDRVVDLWGGHRDAIRTRPWQRDTVTNVWSITKTVSALAALLLVDAGELDVYAPVARYWPEFATNGKQQIEVRHLLSHTSGVSGLDHPARLEDLYDVRAAAARMASQATSRSGCAATTSNGSPTSSLRCSTSTQRHSITTPSRTRPSPVPPSARK